MKPLTKTILAGCCTFLLTLGSMGAGLKASRFSRVPSTTVPGESPKISPRLGRELFNRRAGTQKHMQERVGRFLSRLPLQFVPNQGQFGCRVQFVCDTRSSTYSFGFTGVVLNLKYKSEGVKSDNTFTPIYRTATTAASSSSERTQIVSKPIEMILVGASRSTIAEGADQLQGKANYFIGNDPSKWRHGVATYGRIQYNEIYHSVDLTYSGKGDSLEYDFIVHPGGDPGRIKIAYRGAQGMSVDQSGDLTISTTAGELRQAKPRAFQITSRGKVEIKSSYSVNNGVVALRLGSYDRSKDLVIDPTISYSTLLGGSGFDEADAIAVDLQGNAYVTGMTGSRDFPLLNPVQSEPGFNIFISKLNASRTALEYSTFMGSGSLEDQVTAIAVDSEGSAYITGNTLSLQFPLKSPLQSANAGLNDGFVSKLSPDGSELVYSTYLGGSSEDFPAAIAVDSTGRANIAGLTGSSDFPVANAFQPVRHGFDGFVSKLSPSGGSLTYSTFLGGSRDDSATGIAIDGDGNAYVSGITQSPDFPIHSPIQSSFTAVTMAKSTLGQAGWSPASTGLPQNATIQTVAANSQAVFAIVPGNGLFRSMDSGATWATPSAPPSFVFSGALAVDPVTPSIIYAAAFGGLGGPLFESMDSGNSWQRMSSGVIGGPVVQISVNQSDSAELYALTTTSLFKSSDGGASWGLLRSLNGRGFYYACLAIDPSAPSTVYLATQSGGLLRTTDGGNTWSLLQSERVQFASITCLAVDPGSNSIIYAGTSGQGLQVSNDRGATWKVRIANADGPQITSIVAAATPSSIVYASSPGSGVYQSTNHGKTWRLSDDGLGSVSAYSLAIGGGSSPVVYAGSISEEHCFVTKLSADGSAIIYSTFLGGGSSDGARAIAVDSSGAAYVTGGTFSKDFPTANPAQSEYRGARDAFVAKLDPSGTNLISSTYFGGSNSEIGTAIAVDQDGNAYVTGTTDSKDTPVQGAFQPTSGGGRDGFVARFGSDGSLSYASYLGGESFDSPVGIGTDGSGNVYVAGTTESQKFPTTPGALEQTLAQFDSDAFIVKLNPAVAPLITGASISGKALTVTGENFDTGAVVLIDGKQQRTIADPIAPGTSLIARKGGRQIAPSATVSLQVLDGSGTASVRFSFTRSP